MTAEARGPHDPRLPILGELERELRDSSPGLSFGPQPATRERSSARRDMARIVRRVLLLVVPVGLVAATAVATRTLVSSTGDSLPPPTQAAPLGAGGSDAERWTLTASRRGSQLCDAFFVSASVATRCADEPGPRELLLDGARSPRARYVVGLAGASVRSVSVRVGGFHRTVATRPPEDAVAARRARLPTGIRWFVVTVPRQPLGRAAAASVVPRGGDGRALGPATVTCNAGRATGACVRSERRSGP
jgi:hypothetical protein